MQGPFGVRTAGSPAALLAKLALDARRPHASRKAAQRHCGGRRGATERARTLTCSARVAGMCVNGALQLAFCCTSTSCEHHSGGVSFGRETADREGHVEGLFCRGYRVRGTLRPVIYLGRESRTSVTYYPPPVVGRRYILQHLLYTIGSGRPPSLLTLSRVALATSTVRVGNPA
eukprot:scaffold81439_cov63-Phaeocystis_antarctica.AAC.2